MKLGLDSRPGRSRISGRCDVCGTRSTRDCLPPLASLPSTGSSPSPATTWRPPPCPTPPLHHLQPRLLLPRPAADHPLGLGGTIRITFVHFHPLLSTFIYVHPFSSISIPFDHNFTFTLSHFHFYTFTFTLSHSHFHIHTFTFRFTLSHSQFHWSGL